MNDILNDTRTWQEVDAAIMDFQMHVRKVTGGSDYPTVDSTKLKEAVKNTTKRVALAVLDNLEKGMPKEFTQLDVAKNADLTFLNYTPTEIFNSAISAVKKVIDDEKAKFNS